MFLSERKVNIFKCELEPGPTPNSHKQTFDGCACMP